jgi:D-alanyl-D-alanine carboxypeptidase
MQEAALNDGIELQVVSAFRSASYQLGIIERKLDQGLSMDEILRASAAPGYSEHHSGRVVDISCPGFAALEEEFEQSPAFAWLKGNASRFGFSLSYPRNNKHGITYEPWHWCWRRA